MTTTPLLTLNPCSSDPRSLMALTRRASAYRGAAASAIPSLHKEWLHFCVLDDGVEALINLSVMPRRQAGTGKVEIEGRVVILARVDGRWSGGMDSFDGGTLSARPGQPDLAIGPSRVRFLGQHIQLQARLASGQVSVDLALVPLAAPYVKRPLVRGAVGWAVIPRLLASGQVHTPAGTRQISGPCGYHDHNWGVFRWGDEFLWQWGMGLPVGSSPAWTTVFTRLLDSRRLTETGRALLVWRDQDLVRVFRDLSVVYVSHDLLRRRSVSKFPPVMGLLAPELDTDVPARLSIAGREGEDWVCAQLVVEDIAQLLVPSDRGLGVLVINECFARLEGEGRIDGESFCFEARSIFEHLTAQGVDRSGVGR